MAGPIRRDQTPMFRPAPDTQRTSVAQPLPLRGQQSRARSYAAVVAGGTAAAAGAAPFQVNRTRRFAGNPQSLSRPGSLSETGGGELPMIRGSAKD